MKSANRVDLRDVTNIQFTWFKKWKEKNFENSYAQFNPNTQLETSKMPTYFFDWMPA